MFLKNILGFEEMFAGCHKQSISLSAKNLSTIFWIATRMQHAHYYSLIVMLPEHAVFFQIHLPG